MRKIKLLCLVILVLAGCASTNKELDTKESILLSTDDKKQLVEFYKANLTEDDTYKVKLVTTYLDMKDIKSAELYARTFSEKDRKQPEYIYAQARIAYQKQQYKVAENYLNQYEAQGGDEYQYSLMMGKIKAEKHQYKEAVKYFELSRQQTIDDSEALNNIAVVKMMQKHYGDATKILYDLYIQDKSNTKVRANLIVASVHANRPDIALEALKERYSEEQAHEQLSLLMKSVERPPERKAESKNKIASKQSVPVENVPDTHKKEDKTMPAESSVIAKKQPPKFLQANSDKAVEEDKPKKRHQAAVATPDTDGKKDSIHTVKEDAKKVEKIVKKPIKKSAGIKAVNKPVLKYNSTYRIQVLATYKAISDEYLSYLKKKYGTVYAYTNNLWKRYCIGEFSSIEEAKRFLAETNIRGAFVVDYTKHRHVKL